MVKRASATVDAWVAKSKARMMAVQRESIQRVIDDAQTPTAKGGRMRVDTGFLRASGQASLNSMPTGPVRGDPDRQYEFNDDITELTIARMQPGDTFFFGWTANYARYREVKDAFLRLAVQRWSEIVREVIREAKARIQQ